MAFSDDVFISYAHLDNQALTAGSEGWISSFADALGKRLGAGAAHGRTAALEFELARFKRWQLGEGFLPQRWVPAASCPPGDQVNVAALDAHSLSPVCSDGSGHPRRRGVTALPERRTDESTRVAERIQVDPGLDAQAV